MMLLSSLVIFHTSANINSHDSGRCRYCCAAGAKFYFSRPQNSRNCLKFLDDPLIHDHIQEVLGGAKRHVAPPLQRFWVGPWPDWPSPGSASVPGSRIQVGPSMSKNVALCHAILLAIVGNLRGGSKQPHHEI